MRDIVELLELLRYYAIKEESKAYPVPGLCSLVEAMLIYQKCLTINEANTLKLYMKDRNPTKIEEGGFWFKRYDWQPRIEWLNKQIETEKLKLVK